MSARVVRGIRGAITVDVDLPGPIIEATAELVETLLAVNRCTPQDVVSAWFTVTPDLTSEFPAKGARAAGWDEVPMLCAQEIPVQGALPRCIRVLLHLEVPIGTALVPCYLRDATTLRPDLARRPQLAVER